MDNNMQNTQGSLVSISEFNKLPINIRKDQAEKALEKHPDKIPILCEVDPLSKNLNTLPQLKYLVSDNMNLSELITLFRKKMNLNASEALFIMNYTSKRCLTHGTNLDIVYKKYKDVDGFLKLTIVAENTFG